MAAKRIVIIGLDGVPFRLIEDFSKDGTMPNVGKVIREGVFRRMSSSIPEVSSVAWSSILTGKNPACHGIFGFTDLARNTYRLSFPNFNNLKTPCFWDEDAAARHIVINVPSTYPARTLNGVLISGFVALRLEQAVFPSSLVPKLEEMNYRVDVDSQKAHQSLDLFLRDLERTLDARICAYRHFWQEAWQTFMLVFTGTDRLSHFLWDAYEDRKHKYHAAFLEHFRRVDVVIGEIAENLKKDDAIILLSDHGFELLEKDVYVNFILKEEGLLQLKDSPRPNLSHIDFPTKAFALDPARIYINLEHKYPCGSVSKEDQEKIIKDIEDIFNSLTIDNKKVIRRR
jgi:predicted AlkP superfamily phosphohydrolase/phosphomutase